MCACAWNVRLTIDFQRNKFFRMMAIFGALLLELTGALFNLTVIQGEAYRAESDDNMTRMTVRRQSRQHFGFFRRSVGL